MLAVAFSSVVEVLGASAGGVAGAAVVIDVVLPFAFVLVSPLVAAAMLLLSVAGPNPSSFAVLGSRLWVKGYWTVVRACSIVAAESLMVTCQATSAADLPETGYAPNIQIYILREKDVGDWKRPHFAVPYERMYNSLRLVCSGSRGFVDADVCFP